jgi:hypothetical protein
VNRPGRGGGRRGEAGRGELDVPGGRGTGRDGAEPGGAWGGGVE